ncbi:MAG: TIGR02300 family protein [Pseudomonadota bacterium]
MPKPEWGVKRVCPSCSTRFYDLMRDPMTCPNCGAVFDLASLMPTRGKSARPEPAAPAAKKAAVAKAATDDEDDVDVLDDDSGDSDSDVDLGDDVLEDDDDDQGDVSLDEIADVSDENEES